jgi:hypothetical protein
VGPRLLSVGYPLVGYPDDLLTPKIASYEDAHRLVRSLKEHGAFGIKSYEVARHDSRRWLVDAARVEKMPIFTHYFQVVWMPAVAASEGHTGIEHFTSFPAIGNDWARFLAASGSTVTPTLFNGMYSKWNAYCTVWHSQDDVDAKARRFVSGEDIARQIRPPCSSHLPGPAPVGMWVRDMLDIMHEGGNVSMGAHGELQGPDVHYELKALVEGGMTPFEALETYTVRGARKLGLEGQIGRLLPGYLADLQVLRSDPTVDISRSTGIRYVMVRGILYDADTMARVWPALSSGAAEPAAPPPFESREVAWAAGTGANTVEGTAVQRSADGGRTCAGEQVSAMPRSALADYRMRSIFGSTLHGEIRMSDGPHSLKPSTAQLPEPPASYSAQARRVTCTSAGTFRMSGLPDGNYYFAVSMVPAGRVGQSVSLDDVRVVMKRVSVTGGVTRHLDMVAH